MLICCLRWGRGRRESPGFWAAPRSRLQLPFQLGRSASLPCCRLWLLRAGAGSFVELIHRSPTGLRPPPHGTRASLITGSWWKGLLSPLHGRNRAPGCEDLPEAAQEAFCRARRCTQIPCTSVRRPSPKRWALRSSSTSPSFRTGCFSACSQGGNSLWMQRGDPSQGQVPSRHEPPC